ncbi:MAG: hypothetical protein ACLQVJ_04895 [Syntrophobacteraceae bacterium]
MPANSAEKILGAGEPPTLGCTESTVFTQALPKHCSVEILEEKAANFSLPWPAHHDRLVACIT